MLMASGEAKAESKNLFQAQKENQMLAVAPSTRSPKQLNQPPPQAGSTPAKKPTCSPGIATSDAEVALDGSVIVIVSILLSFSSRNLLTMSIAVPALLILRTILWQNLRLRGRDRLKAELLFLGICTILGAGNDYNTVVRHGVYSYGAPVFFPDLTTIPIWMLLYWGMILRFIATLAGWARLGSDPLIRNQGKLGSTHWKSGKLKIGIQLLLVLATRQAIYRFYLDPVLSWLPFLVAGILYFLIFLPDRRERWLAGAALTLGTGIEVLYIQVGGLHQYHLGWIGGVPLWIALWWGVAVVVWKDLSLRILASLTGEK